MNVEIKYKKFQAELKNSNKLIYNREIYQN